MEKVFSWLVSDSVDPGVSNTVNNVGLPASELAKEDFPTPPHPTSSTESCLRDSSSEVAITDRLALPGYLVLIACGLQNQSRSGLPQTKNKKYLSKTSKTASARKCSSCQFKKKYFRTVLSSTVHWKLAP
eukprot:scpid83454/ scgid12071/ 